MYVLQKWHKLSFMSFNLQEFFLSVHDIDMIKNAENRSKIFMGLWIYDFLIEKWFSTLKHFWTFSQ